MVINKLYGNVTNKKIAILGFSFKADTNDTRESPAILICKELLNEGAILYIHDPQVTFSQIEFELGKTGQENSSNWFLSKELEKSFYNADAIIILTEWDIYKEIDWKHVSKMVRSPAWIFDTRKIVDPKLIKDCEFNFWQVGLGDKINN